MFQASTGLFNLNKGRNITIYLISDLVARYIIKLINKWSAEVILDIKQLINAGQKGQALF